MSFLFFKNFDLFETCSGQSRLFNFSETWQPWYRSTLDVSIIQSESKEDSRFIRLITTAVVIVVAVADNISDRKVRLEFWTLLLQGTKFVVVVVVIYGRQHYHLMPAY